MGLFPWLHALINRTDVPDNKDEIVLLTILQTIQGLLGLILIGLVLIHSPKGDGIGGIGGAAQLFSSQRGAEAGLTKVTAWVVALFFLVCATTGLYGHFLAGTP
jgi:preprotein translocase subunit SecG